MLHAIPSSGGRPETLTTPVSSDETAPLQADLRCLADDFFAVSFAGFLPSIGISISFWPAAAFRGFLAGFFGASASAAPPPTVLCP
ncbi:hypothetical protein [Bradyrhizobium genosp. P]|uniref:hypothetical protein n=1 Tax=Bradyrhizobium genosp. P TaxID=83641 RepID=UPI003CE9F745